MSLRRLSFLLVITRQRWSWRARSLWCSSDCKLLFPSFGIFWEFWPVHTKIFLIATQIWYLNFWSKKIISMYYMESTFTAINKEPVLQQLQSGAPSTPTTQMTTLARWATPRQRKSLSHWGTNCRRVHKLRMLHSLLGPSLGVFSTLSTRQGCQNVLHEICQIASGADSSLSYFLIWSKPLRMGEFKDGKNLIIFFFTLVLYT